MALGATLSTIVSMVLKTSGAMVIAGLLVGAAAAWSLTGFVKSFLFQVQSTDPVVFAGTILILLTVGGLAAVVPARRAAGIDPVRCLR